MMIECPLPLTFYRKSNNLFIISINRFIMYLLPQCSLFYSSSKNANWGSIFLTPTCLASQKGRRLKKWHPGNFEWKANSWRMYVMSLIMCLLICMCVKQGEGHTVKNSIYSVSRLVTALDKADCVASMLNAFYLAVLSLLVCWPA